MGITHLLGQRLLLISFNDNSSFQGLVDKLHKTTFKHSVTKTFHNIQYSLSMMLNNIYLSLMNEELQEKKASYCHKLAYDHFLSIIPDKCKDKCKDTLNIRENISDSDSPSIYDIMFILGEHNLLHEKPTIHINNSNGNIISPIDTNMPKTSNLNSPFDYEGLRREPLYKLLYHGSKNNFKDFNIDPTPIPILYPLNAPTAPSAPTAPKSLEFKFTEPAPGEWCEFLGDFVPKK